MKDFIHPAPEAGLTYEQVQAKKANGRQNIQPEKSTKSTGRILKDNICTLFNLFNLLIAVALALAGAWSNLLSIVCLVLNIPFPFLPIQITLIDLVIEGYPAFFMSFEPDGRKITGRFLPAVMKRALPNALSILLCFLVFQALSPILQIPAEQAGTLLYLLVGTVGIQAVFKASWPFDTLRFFLCATMTAGFYAAVMQFHPILQIALPTGLTLVLFLGFALLSFLAERGITALIGRAGRQKQEKARFPIRL